MQKAAPGTKSEDIMYTVQYSRRRTLGIGVCPDKGVVVRVPVGTSRKVIDEIINEKSDWIRKAQKYHSSLTRLDQNSRFGDGESILYRGEENLLRVIPSDKYYIRRSNHTIEVGITGKHNPQLIKTMLESWYKVVAVPILTELFHKTLSEYKEFAFSPSGFSVRKMKKRWGSCTSKGKIAISYDLVRLDPVFARYVILHELCHLRHHNHGQGFYNLLSDIYPDWRAVREKLKQIIR